MDLSISIVNWNTGALLRSCLESVFATARNPGVEVVVVDNGSTDGSPALVERAFPDVTLIRNATNQGFARANNQAIQASSGRYILLLNSDAVLLPDAARTLVEFLDSHPDAGAAGGILLNPDGSFQSSYMDFPSVLGETLLLTGLSRWLLPATFPSHGEDESWKARPVDWVSGAFLMVRREALDAVGMLDDDYFMYTEEVDWCYRMWRHDWAVYTVPSARVIHHGGGTSRRVPERKRAQLYQSKRLFMRKHYGWPRATFYDLLVRGVSGLKLGIWRGMQLSPRSSQRAYARENVRSYRALLASF